MPLQSYMDFLKTSLLLLVAFFGFNTSNCSSLTPENDNNTTSNCSGLRPKNNKNALVVGNSSETGNNGPYLPDDIFGSYKLIRPLPNPWKIYFARYDLLAAIGVTTYTISKLMNYPKIFRDTCMSMAYFMVILHLPAIFGYRWTASFKNGKTIAESGTFVGLIEMPIDEIFLTEGTISLDPENCFGISLAIYRFILEQFKKLLNRRPFRRF